MGAHAGTDWKEARLAGWGKGLRIIVPAAFALAALWLLMHPQTPVPASLPLQILLCLVVLVFCHKIAAACFDRILWNDAGIRYAPVVGPQRRFDWAELSGIETEMKRRATLLSFGRWRRLRLFWSYDRYREIADLAERKMENA